MQILFYSLSLTKRGFDLNLNTMNLKLSSSCRIEKDEFKVILTVFNNKTLKNKSNVKIYNI